MQRRKFVKSIAGAGVLLSGSSCTSVKPLMEEGLSKIKPKRLSAGDTVGLICPAGPINQARLDKAITNVESLGFKTKVGKYVLATLGYNAGTEAQRLSDLHGAFMDPDIDAVWAVRGGYGCTQLLPQIDFTLIRNHPKLLIGYSDITALLCANYLRAGLVGLHGPVASSTFEPMARESFLAVATQPSGKYRIQGMSGATVIVPGRASGQLMGGNLSLLASLCGTGYLPDFADRLVFIEDVGEAPYRIDRMLVQLLQATNLSRAAGILLGDFVDCERKPDSSSLTLVETLSNRLGHLKLPVYHGLPFGHGDLNASLPIGCDAEIDTKNHTLTILSGAVS